MSKQTGLASAPELLVLDHVAIRWADRVIFPGTCWTWRRGEQWALLGANGSGKSAFALALCGKAALARGEIHYSFGDDSGKTAIERFPESFVALISPRVQRDMAREESSFYQSRWHSGITEGKRTVAQFLSRASVENTNPFEVGARTTASSQFARDRRRFSRWLGIRHLLRRRLLCLSNGEQRRVLMVHVLLRSPRLLILDNPFDGLDEATRARLLLTIRRLMRRGMPVLVLTSRPDELPPGATHVLLVNARRVIAQGPRKRVLGHPLSRRLSAHQDSDAAGNLERKPAARSRRGAREDASAGRRRQPAPLAEFNHVTLRAGKKRVLADVTWTIRRGENWALLGPNGSGKTSLLNLIQGDNPRAYALDLRLFGARPESTRGFWRMRRRIGWLSPELHQHYPPGWSCLEVACSGYFNALGLHQACTTRERQRARQCLRSVGLGRLEQSLFDELSAGDQRLVLLARAAVRKPRLLILDEPCQGLDARHRHIVLATTDALIRSTEASLIFVTHHARELPRCITHAVELRGGRIARARKVNP